MRAWWDDLASSELSARLRQRGVTEGEVAALVDDRDRSITARTRITWLLR